VTWIGRGKSLALYVTPAASFATCPAGVRKAFLSSSRGVPLAVAVTAMTEHTRAATNAEMIVRFFTRVRR
jgi:hypothetical protein